MIVDLSYSNPRLIGFPVGVLISGDLGTLNFAKIKGSHTAMKSRMLAAEAMFAGREGSDELKTT